MKTASVRQLRNDYASVLRWVEKGQPVAIRRRNRIVAHLVPADAHGARPVDWSKSAAKRMDKSLLPFLRAADSAALLAASRGER